MSITDDRGRQELIRVVVGCALRPLVEIEAEIMSIALARYQQRGGKTRAARELGIARATLYRRLRRCGEAAA